MMKIDDYGSKNSAIMRPKGLMKNNSEQGVRGSRIFVSVLLSQVIAGDNWWIMGSMWSEGILEDKLLYKVRSVRACFHNL